MLDIKFFFSMLRHPDKFYGFLLKVSFKRMFSRVILLFRRIMTELKRKKKRREEISHVEIFNPNFIKKQVILYEL